MNGSVASCINPPPKANSTRNYGFTLSSKLPTASPRA